MKKAIGVALSIAVFSLGCTSVEQVPEQVIVKAHLPSDTHSAVILAMPMKPGALKNVQNLHDAPQVFARELRWALAFKYPKWKITLAEDNKATPDADITITTQLLEVDGGSAALRFWVGFGAGEIMSRVNVSIQDKRGQILATSDISTHTTCPLGACTEENEPAVRQNLKNLAASAAEFIANPEEFAKKKE